MTIQTETYDPDYAARQPKRCCICSGKIKILRDRKTGRILWVNGNNAWPVKDGICCDRCNAEEVLPARFDLMFSEEIEPIPKKRGK